MFSLNVNKTIQCGEGAVCITRDEDVRYRLALIRNHGEAVVGPAGYADITNMLGFNYRLTEVSAAIAIEQLRKLDGLNRVRLELVGTLTEALKAYDFVVPPPQCVHAGAFDAAPRCDCRSTYYVYPMRYQPERLGVPRADVARALKAEGIVLGVGYVRPLYLQPLYQTKTAFKHGYPWSAPENRAIETNYHEGACPSAERLHFHEMLVSEHVRPPLEREDVLDIARAIGKLAA